MPVFQLYPKHGVRKGLRHGPYNLNSVLFGHKRLLRLSRSLCILRVSCFNSCNELRTLNPTQNLRSVLRDSYRVFEMRRQAPILRYRSPPVFFEFHFRFPGIHHGFYGQDHALN